MKTSRINYSSSEEIKTPHAYRSLNERLKNNSVT